MTPSLDLINWLEYFTKLRKTVYLLDYWFIIKGLNSGTARRKRCIGQIMRKGMQSFLALSEHATIPRPLHVHQPGNSPNLVLLGFYEGFTTEA